jgi:hypothetical protein
MRMLNTFALVFILGASVVNTASAFTRVGNPDYPQNGGGGAPEPTTILLLAAGGGIVAFKRYKSRKSQKNSDKQ